MVKGKRSRGAGPTPVTSPRPSWGRLLRQGTARGAGPTPVTSPRPPRGRFCDTSRAEWGVRGLGAGRAKWRSGAGEGASFKKSCSRLHQSMISTPHALKVAQGGLGPRGRACEVVLWCRRGRIFSKIMLSPAPERVFLHLMFVNAFLRGRRQLPQAGEVRRPPGPACVRRWRYRFKNTVLEEHDGTRQEEQGGWGNHSY